MNPYPTKPGFGFRVLNAKRSLERLGRDCTARIYTRGFDNNFEMFDGKAVVWALMNEAIAKDNYHLKLGIKRMGAAVWPQWLAVYQPKAQADLFQKVDA